MIRPFPFNLVQVRVLLLENSRRSKVNTDDDEIINWLISRHLDSVLVILQFCRILIWKGVDVDSGDYCAAVWAGNEEFKFVAWLDDERKTNSAGCLKRNIEASRKGVVSCFQLSEFTLALA